MQKAEKTMQTIEEDMKEASAKLTEEQIDEVRNLMDENFSHLQLEMMQIITITGIGMEK